MTDNNDRKPTIDLNSLSDDEMITVPAGKVKRLLEAARSAPGREPAEDISDFLENWADFKG